MRRRISHTSRMAIAIGTQIHTSVKVIASFHIQHPGIEIGRRTLIGRKEIVSYPTNPTDRETGMRVLSKSRMGKSLFLTRLLAIGIGNRAPTELRTIDWFHTRPQVHATGSCRKCMLKNELWITLHRSPTKQNGVKMRRKVIVLIMAIIGVTGGMFGYQIYLTMRIPVQTGHTFHGKLDSHSRANWTLIPRQIGQ